MDDTSKPDSSLLPYLSALYGPEIGQTAFKKLQRRIQAFRGRYSAPLVEPLHQGDSILITYGDQFQQEGENPLQTLFIFYQKHLRDFINGIHILPFFPYSSDDGFSVIDYRAVNPELGAWEEVRRLGEHVRLMFDAVVNHISSESDWFQGFLEGASPYRDYFITVPPDTDLSMVVRPRALPLLTPVQTAWGGEKHVWTTFSADQIDQDYANPDVLVEMLDILLFYVENGAQLIRLDAIAYLWKEIGTSCIHLPQTYKVVELMRAMLDLAAPHVQLVTETNVPHEDNVSYFGSGSNMAQMVYNFALPPLVMHALRTGNAEKLSRWAAGLTLPSRKVTFFNFLASHDGVGLNPAIGILSDEEINDLVQGTLARGGLISSKANPDGSESPYEMNINYFDALSTPGVDEPLELQVNRFMTSQAILLAIVGVPGIYVHSLLGSRGWQEGVTFTGHKRTINRQKFSMGTLTAELADAASLRGQVYRRYMTMLQKRAAEDAFHPHGVQMAIDAGKEIFCVLRFPQECGQPILCLHNVSGDKQAVLMGLVRAHLQADHLRDLLSGEVYSIRDDRGLSLLPYQTLWLKPET